MAKKPGLVAVTDWRAEMKDEARQKVFMSILAKLRQSSSPFLPYEMYIEKITKHAREQENRLLKTAKSKEQYYSGLTRMLSGSENPRAIASNQDHPAVIIKKEEAFHSQPLPQMTNQPHQWVVRNLQNNQPAVSYSLLEPNTPQSTLHLHEQLYGHKLNTRQTSQNFGFHNQSCLSAQNTLNSPCQPRGVQSRVLGTHMTPEIVIQHPKVVKLQPNEYLSAEVKKEVICKDFHASTFLHKHISAFEQHKQHQSLRVPAVPNGNSNAEEWLGPALSEVRCLRKYLPLLKKIYEKTSEHLLQARQIELMQKLERQNNLLQIMINFLEFPEDRIISYFTKDIFYRRVQFIWKNVKVFENWSVIANKQKPLRGRPNLSQSHMNPVQQRDNVNPHFQLVNSATTGSYDSSSPRAPREIGSLSSAAGCIQKCMLRKKQNSENTMQEFQSSWTQQNQKSTENIKASNRSGMCLEHHLNAKFSPETLEELSTIAEQAVPINPSATFNDLELHLNAKFSPETLEELSKITGQAVPINPSATFNERAPPIPPTSTIELEKDPTNPTNPANPSNSQCSQGCNPLKLHESKTVIQVQSPEIRSSSTMTCQLAEPTNLGNKVQLSTETQPHYRLLKAVESISNEALRVAVSEISSAMEDRITEPWCCEKDGCSFSSNLKRKIDATTLNDMPSPCSVIDESESVIVTSSYKKLKKMSDDALLEEMKKINSQFIETVLEFDTDEKFNRQWADTGTVLRLSYRAATESKNSVPHSAANSLKFPVLSIKLLLPHDYPEHYPVFLSKFDTAHGTEDDVLKGMSREAGLLLPRFLPANHDYLSLEDYAKAWNECARSVVSDYAKHAGGVCFSSRYGTWEDFC